MFGRIWHWCRRNTVLVDAFLATPLFLLALAGALVNPAVEPTPFVIFSLALLVPLVLRRTYPRSVFAWVCLVSFVQVIVYDLPLAANMAVLMGLYTVTAGFSLRWGLAALAVGQLGVVLYVLRFVSDWEVRRTNWFALTVIVTGVWLLGLYMRTRRAYLRSVEERAAKLERERDNEVRVAKAGERARIARELHDVVAHNVSVMVVQADGASYAIETDRAKARTALEDIADTGRQALAEMRRMLGVLRESDGPDATAPQPGVQQLADLVEQLRGSGLSLEFEDEGEPVQLSAGRQLTVFRIVQESLTNTRKHGGPGARARVYLHYRDDAVEVRVTDDGRGADAPTDGRGHGLLGMRERVEVFGGEVTTGPRPGGGFEVYARIPVGDDEAHVSAALKEVP